MGETNYVKDADHYEILRSALERYAPKTEEAGLLLASLNALRVTLYDRNREIERLKAEIKADLGLIPDGVVVHVLHEGDAASLAASIHNLVIALSDSQAREREVREEARINLESAKAEAIDRDAMLARAMQAEAREREAVERAEKAEEVLMRAARCEQHGADLTRLLEDPECARVWIQEGYDGAYALVAELNTALAAARKALEDRRHAMNEWADAAINGLQWLRNIRDGISSTEEAIKSMDGNIKHCREVDRAALNGDSHGR